MRQCLTLLAFAMISMAHGQVAEFVPAEGLVAWYNLDGSGMDMSSMGNHLNSVEAIPATNRFGEEEQALFFDAQGSHVSNSSFFGIPSNSSHSISFWEKHELASSSSGMVLVQNGNVVHGAKLHYGYRGEEGDCPGGVCMGIDFWGPQHFTQSQLNEVWRHWVLSYDHTTTSTAIFMDGELISTQVMGEAYAGDFDEGLTIGSFDEPYGFQSGFIGVIDELGVWNRTLTEEEVLGLFYASPVEYGCTDASACNFDVDALVDDSSCHFNCLFCQEGTVWSEETQGCVVANSSDTDFDGCVGMVDLLDLLSVFGTCAETESESDPLEWSCGDPLEYQGYDYETVQIEEQCWFAENLKATTYQNGQDIPLHDSFDLWMSWAPARCAPDSNLTLVEDFGWLYNGMAVNDDRGLCPSNWHVSTDADWMILETLVGVEDSILSITGHRCNTGLCALPLKAAPLDTPPWTGSNATGFSAVPSGQRQWADYNGHGGVSTFWCEESGTFTNFFRAMHANNTGDIYRGSTERIDGRSVRCVQDAE